MKIKCVCVCDVLCVTGEQKTRGIVEENADTVVAQLVPDTVFITVIDPLADPVDRHGGRVFRVVYNEYTSASGVTVSDSPGGSMRRGQRTFRTDNKEDRRTCFFGVTLLLGLGALEIGGGVH